MVPRVSDLPFIMPSFQGKVEFEAMEEGQEDKITNRIVQSAVKAVFDRHYDVNDLESVAYTFNEGLTVETGDAMRAVDYRGIVEQVPGLGDVFRDETDGMRAAIIEFILEGLHLHKLLNKYSVSGRSTYTG